MNVFENWWRLYTRISNLRLRWFQAHINMLNILDEWVRKLGNSALIVGSNSASVLRLAACNLLCPCAFYWVIVFCTGMLVFFARPITFVLYDPLKLYETSSRFNRWISADLCFMLCFYSLERTANSIAIGQLQTCNLTIFSISAISIHFSTTTIFFSNLLSNPVWRINESKLMELYILLKVWARYCNPSCSYRSNKDRYKKIITWRTLKHA